MPLIYPSNQKIPVMETMVVSGRSNPSGWLGHSAGLANHRLQICLYKLPWL